MGPADFQRYKKLLLEKRRELSSARDDTRARVPAVGGLQGDLKDESQCRSRASDSLTSNRRSSLKGHRRSIGSDQAGHVRNLRRLQSAYLWGEWCCGGKIMRAYIVVAMGPGKSRDVARKIASLPGVKMADACCGSRDVFAVAEVEESQELNKLVIDTIERPEGVAGTSTHIALD